MCHMHLNACISWHSCWRVNAIHFRLWRGLHVRVCMCPMLWLRVLWHAYHLHIVTPNSHGNVGHFIRLFRCWLTDWYVASKQFCKTVMRSQETTQHAYKHQRYRNNPHSQRDHHHPHHDDHYHQKSNSTRVRGPVEAWLCALHHWRLQSMIMAWLAYTYLFLPYANLW